MSPTTTTASRGTTDAWYEDVPAMTNEIRRLRRLVRQLRREAGDADLIEDDEV